MNFPLKKKAPARFAKKKAKPARASADKRIADIYEWMETAVFTLAILAFVFTFLVRIAGVDGPSMQTTLYDQERVFLQTLFYTPQRGDIVVVDRYAEEPMIKRVIAVEGDTLRIDPITYEVYLNGQKLYEPYVNDQPTPLRDVTGEITVAEGHVFVMGDNRLVSHDSRATDIGQVNVKDIRGKAIFRIWPFERIGAVE